MIILGIDPGLAIVGFGVLEVLGDNRRVIEYGEINSPAHTPTPKRIKMIYDDVSYVINKYKPDCMAIEELFFNNNAKTAIDVAMARGALVLAAENAGIDVAEYTPLQVKQAVVGYGRADKNQVQQMVKLMLKLHEVPKPDDVADALAIALTHANTIRFELKISN
ncbi:MAG: crossover junction endodeoxyribonuclease RuvC [Clostridiales bacterium]|jgi:crossover junction endodeoxyribonuclease RuvC|nr:crossover junction endodeoxyribonuclease RuvC [Clostridiales bacterium]